jgi:hypothetical protein
MLTGAVYNPVSEMVPQADFEQPGPDTLHVTEASVMSFPEATNFSVEPAGTRTSTQGEMLIGVKSKWQRLESWLDAKETSALSPGLRL